MNTSFEPKTLEPKRRASQEESQSAISYPSRTIVHAKLEMTSPGDRDEQEADAVANEVVSGGKIARKISGGGGSSGIAVSRQMESRLLQQQGGGQPMPSGLRSKMESSFGRDLSQVRLHTDSNAVSMSNSIHAMAFTHGNDIYFNRGQFSPETSAGQHLVAHELTHVVQGTGKVGREFNPIFGDKKSVQTIDRIDPINPDKTEDEPTKAFLKNVVLDAKSLAKEMVSRSIYVLTQMENGGKYLSLFYYCFDRLSYISRLRGRRPAIPRSKIRKVINNYEKILGVLSNNDNLDNHKILLVLQTRWDNLSIDQEYSRGIDLESAGGFAYQNSEGLQARFSKLDRQIREIDSQSLSEEQKILRKEAIEKQKEKYNKVFLRFTSSTLSNDYINYNIYPDSENGEKKYSYNWLHRQRLASTIIHELSHRVCGTDDLSYLNMPIRQDWDHPRPRNDFESDADGNVLTDDRIDLVNNASSYEVFSSWVESTVYSVFDANYNVNNNSGDWSLDENENLYTDHGIPKSAP